ncbi:hypothetical protein GURKE_04720 [Brevundimonas phage vB_BpoS-Gurke]|uniref:Uncharacterized protein n=1 Tax=Brevundimonas phage vB_BpoS-Gurke TaxID=2948599 RepID=A0A9E7SQY6_9CAUD|nr:hypothetical protein GURKE_04720 [Brevundimonas phage vB_BpoS-Gurke]
MTTQAQRLAAEAFDALKAALADQPRAPYEGPAFTGSSNCLANIERDYARRRRGHWFDPNAMRGFGTRFPSGFTDHDAYGATTFVTTEKGANGERRASLRAYLWKSAQIVTLGAFCVHSTAVVNKAHDELFSLIRDAAKVKGGKVTA